MSSSFFYANATYTIHSNDFVFILDDLDPFFTVAHILQNFTISSRFKASVRCAREHDDAFRFIE